MRSPISKIFEGQHVMINMDSKIVIMQLNNKFELAGQILKWDHVFGSDAFGINRTIINFILDTKFKLLIRYSMEPQREYWINHDSLHNFIKKNNCLTIVSKSKMLYNVPLSLFSSKPVFSGALS